MTSLKKNFFYNIVYQILMVILPLITAPYVSRVLGVDGIGTYSYVYSIAYYFGICGMLGISNHGNRNVVLANGNRKKLSETFWNLYSIQFVTTLFVLILYVLYVVFVFSGNHMVAFIDILFVFSYVLNINWFFFGMEKFKLTVTRNIIIKISTVLCTFIFVKNSDDLWKYTLIMALGMVLSQGYLWLHIRKYIDFAVPSLKKIKAHIKPMLILFIPVIAFSIYKVMDKIMLGLMTTVRQVGLYENADKIVYVPLGVITAFGTVMMPRISALLVKKATKQIYSYSILSFKYFTILTIGMTFGLIGVSDMLAPVYFGKEFIGCSPIIAGLSITLLFIAWSEIIRTQYLIPNNKDTAYVISMIAGAVVNLLFNIIFIPKLQAIGALIGTILAEFTVFAVQAWFVRKEYPVLSFLKPNLVYFPMGIIMAVAVRLIGAALGQSVLTLCLQVIFGVVIYGIMVLAYLICIKDSFIFAILKKLRLIKDEL